LAVVALAVDLAAAFPDAFAVAFPEGLGVFFTAVLAAFFSEAVLLVAAASLGCGRSGMG
jgi:hypothetical protein